MNKVRIAAIRQTENAISFLIDVKLFVVGWRLDREQVEHGVEDVMLLEYRGQ